MRNSTSREKNSPFLIFTDLDGTLLDHETYRWDQAEEAIGLCRERRVPVILVSSKTRAEMNPLRLELGLAAPFISENGGGIFFPAESPAEPPLGGVLADDLWKWSLGRPYPEVVAALEEIREELQWPLRGFSDMSLEEISLHTGLTEEKARLAAMREFDEPFIVPRRNGMDWGRLLDAAARRELQVTEGDRFFHLHGSCDKGAALERVVRWYRSAHGPVKTAALGDSPNDFSMLKRVDYPVLVKSEQVYRDLAQQIPSLRTTEEKGAAGWNAAVTALLSGKWNQGIRPYV